MIVLVFVVGFVFDMQIVPVRAILILLLFFCDSCEVMLLFRVCGDYMRHKLALRCVYKVFDQCLSVFLIAIHQQKYGKLTVVDPLFAQVAW